MPRSPKVVVVGLDCLAPELVFDRLAGELPTFRVLREQGAWGPLESVDPPITVPAWSCMLSGFSPAQLGLYGFRHRKLGSYDARYLATSEHVKLPRVWDRLGEAGLESGLLGVPQTWPVRPMKGWCALDFQTPSAAPGWAYPPELEKEIGAPRFDVEKLRSGDLERIARDVFALSTQRFELFRDLLARRGADFAMMVDISPDRVHHAFWRFFDERHPRHEPGHALASVIPDFYRHLDAQLAKTVAALAPEAHLFVVSDHGAQAMEGGFCLNDWLVREGYLVLKRPAAGPRAFDEKLVDFGRTRAWGWGGYCGRIFVNLAGREPCGQVRPDQYEPLLAEIEAKLRSLQFPSIQSMKPPPPTRVLRPSDLGEGPPQGDWPDLLVYPEDLRYRAIASVGNPSLFTLTNDTGPDDANHAKHGVYIHRGPGVVAGKQEGLKLIDVGPSILRLFGL
ncbi:MAG TPA: alkaline phosphatase family protein [Myxococcales bacterium]|jgi:predicted AlkP superfamily phosphohydrolase/phosphomutase